MPAENGVERVIADLFEVIRTQHKVLSYCISTNEALMGTLAELLPGFEATFQGKHSISTGRHGL